MKGKKRKTNRKVFNYIGWGFKTNKIKNNKGIFEAGLRQALSLVGAAEGKLINSDVDVAQMWQREWYSERQILCRNWSDLVRLVSNKRKGGGYHEEHGSVFTYTLPLRKG